MVKHSLIREKKESYFTRKEKNLNKRYTDPSTKAKVKIVVKQVQRGEIYFANFEKGEGCEQNGTRPVLIIQNDVGNRFSPTTIVALITSVTKKLDLPTHIELPNQISLLPYHSVVLLEQLKTIDKNRLEDRVSKLDQHYMQKVNEGLSISLGMHPDFT
ncbi:type II toxin-antitoxin system PemK/MazF family toxin [Paenibacillus polymyxa]|uniref:type II toxin-antitoxin system PemK/MazF family toxin n=1 Tax=Paenibacillus polymyxa TaxID=1406 RepID=UPI0001E6C92D|nr:type II toxin-antitoxin system PemK/MazF family toxin [Paenibacillus polymyxa]WPQ59724.1 type II toxin-antitoxin system PemK/MazF family toxin [Paenibacillus polymyxa]